MKMETRTSQVPIEQSVLSGHRSLLDSKTEPVKLPEFLETLSSEIPSNTLCYTRFLARFFPGRSLQIRYLL